MSLTPKVSILSKKQQNKSLSAKKKPLKTIRHILSSQKASFWPVLEDSTSLIAELVLFKFRKSTLRKENMNSEDSPSHMDVDTENEMTLIRKSILFGINEVSRSLKRDECSAFMFDAAVPRILVQHLIYMASNKNVPVMGVNGLTDTIRASFGLKSSTICLRKEPSNKFSSILDIIKKCSNSPKEINVLEIKPYPGKEPIESLTLKSNKTNVVYLFRTNKKERAFVPESIKVASNKVEMKDPTSSNYIKIDESKQMGNRKKKENFKPLLVRKIQNNATRQKNKNIK